MILPQPFERRQAIRFPIRLPVRYRLADESSWGRTVDLSSRGALLSLRHRAQPGERVELSISWPVLLHGEVHLTLVAAGTVVRVEERGTAVRFAKSSFRTSSAGFHRQALLADPQTPRLSAATDPAPYLKIETPPQTGNRLRAR